MRLDLGEGKTHIIYNSSCIDRAALGSSKNVGEQGYVIILEISQWVKHYTSQR